jgi:hypothetical protein
MNTSETFPPAVRTPITLLDQVEDFKARCEESLSSYEPVTPVKAPFNRAEHCRRIAQSGGFTTSERYGSSHMSHIGKIGYAVTKQVHGAGRAQEILKGKGWKRSQMTSLAQDLRGF